MSVSFVRTLVADRRKTAVNEIVGEGDGTNRFYQFDMFPLVSSPTANVTIFLTGVTAATNTYTLSGDVGRLTFLAGSIPANGATILGNYDYFALTSGEISNLLSGVGNKVYLAAANACLVLAADASRLFAYTMGDKSVDKRKVCSNLIELSKEFENRHYTMVDKDGFDGTVFSFKDDTGTPYSSYDSAVAFLNETS